MNRPFLRLSQTILFQLICFSWCFGQNTYSALVNKGNNFRHSKDYYQAKNSYQRAFKVNPDSAKAIDFYFYACVMVKINEPDSALLILNIAAKKYKLNLDDNLATDTVWSDLRNRKDWQKIRSIVKRNLEATYSPLQKEMISIAYNDQVYRHQADSIQRTEGIKSKKLPYLIRKMHRTDSLNLIQTEKILDKYGWPSPAEYGNTVEGLFLVIQHADVNTQLKYLPLFKDALKTKYFWPPNLALLEDRIAVSQGKKQFYGTQIYYDAQLNIYKLQPIEDEVNVNSRRKEVGLEPLQDYVKHWNIIYVPINKVSN